MKSCSIESMMLFYQLSDNEILEFYSEAFQILKDKNFVLFYLDSDQIRENILQIKKERSDIAGNEMWFPLMLKYLNTSPYGQAHHYQNIDDMVAHFERRHSLEKRIISEVVGSNCQILTAKNYEWEEVVIPLV